MQNTGCIYDLLLGTNATHPINAYVPTVCIRSCFIVHACLAQTMIWTLFIHCLKRYMSLSEAQSTYVVSFCCTRVTTNTHIQHFKSMDVPTFATHTAEVREGSSNKLFKQSLLPFDYTQFSKVKQVQYNTVLDSLSLVVSCGSFCCLHIPRSI